MAFLDKCGYSLTLHPYLTISNFIKVSCTVESKTASVNFFVFCYIKTHWFVLHLLLPLHEFPAYSGHLIIHLSYADLPDVDTYRYMVPKFHIH